MGQTLKRKDIGLCITESSSCEPNLTSIENKIKLAKTNRQNSRREKNAANLWPLLVMKNICFWESILLRLENEKKSVLSKYLKVGPGKESKQTEHQATLERSVYIS